MLFESSGGREASDDSPSQTPQSPTSRPLPQESGAKPRRTFSVLAGWMIVIAGVVSFFNGLRALIDVSSPGVIDFVFDPDKYTICAVVIMVFGVAAVLGGIFALRGKYISFAFVGATLGILGGGIVGFWLGLAAILCLFLSSEDF